MLNASTITVNKEKFKADRRRTWCPTSNEENNENDNDSLKPLGMNNKPQKSQISRFKNFLTPQIFNRDPQKNLSPSCESLPSLEDVEFPEDSTSGTSPKTPTKSSTCTECQRRRSFGLPVRASLTPVGTRER